MPKIVNIAIAVVSREGQKKSELIGMRRQPPKCICVFELPSEVRAIRAADVDGAAAVMLAVTWRGIDREDGWHDSYRYALIARFKNKSHLIIEFSSWSREIRITTVLGIKSSSWTAPADCWLSGSVSTRAVAGSTARDWNAELQGQIYVLRFGRFQNNCHVFSRCYQPADRQNITT